MDKKMIKKLIKDAEWNIGYHTEKLKEYKTLLEQLKKK